MATYQELQEQIKQLSLQAEAARKAEAQAVIDDINAKIKAYNISAADLSFPGKASKSKAGKSSSQALYRSPDGKKTWNGKGRMPFWYQNATDREALRI